MKREFAVVAGKRKEEVVVENDDLVLVTAPNFSTIHEKIVFFKGFLSDEIVDFQTFDDKHLKSISLRVVGCIEIIARYGTIQHEILLEALLQNRNLKSKLNQIKKNFAELLCEE